MANSLGLIEILVKAVRAEQRNGCTNAGVMGGFANFLLLSAEKLASHPQAGQTRYRVILERLKDLAGNYLEITPRQRQKSLGEIEKLIDALHKGLGTAPAHLNLVHLPDNVPVNKDRANILYNSQPGVKNSGQRVTSPEKSTSPKKSWKSETGTGNTDVRPGSPAGQPIQYLKSVGPQRAKLLARLGINTVEDLLNHFPRRYEDRRNVKQICQVIHGEVETVRGTVVSQQELKPRRGLKIIKMGLSDGSSTITAVWFNNPYLLKQLPRGTQLLVTGKVDRRFGGMELAVSDHEVIDDQEFNPGIVPVYPGTDSLSSKQLRTLLGFALEKVEELMPEILPDRILKKFTLMGRPEAYGQVHFPRDFAAKEEARRRLVFEEFVLLQLGLQRVRGEKVRLRGVAMEGSGSLVREFRNNLPFALTKAQVRVVEEVFHDMSLPHPMARLVQGDVGSGKTVVAALALLKAVECGYQGAMMAPTEILAEQHFLYFREVLEPLGVKVRLLKGSTGKKDREEVLFAVAEGNCDVVVGTHALIQEGVNFKALGIAITDEQHRFGVRQRAVLQQKGTNPHVLVMTATPIPRTLALTLYGDLNLSVIDELPPGRKEIKTIHITEKSREKLYQFIAKEIATGRQAYVVCPLVEESEVLDLKAATELAEVLSQRFANFRVGLLHGRMKTQEKETVIDKFRLNQVQILVSTTVVEVGVNVPNASVMVIEGAERFGLAQLHQLRGRVGRGEYQSYCLLVSNAFNEDIKRRLGIMCQTNDGFKIAEADLQIRGPGEFFGTRQHGLPELKIADILHDGAMLEQARQTAEELLKSPEHDLIFQEAAKKFGSQRLERG
ncbi:MAG TPA: ATP-dependent DNA helicase RecG [Verrucomicrobiae bacterium]|nr:ATP-dependent DNA helicase RecG [Verrucomicrobiae bacterium]